MCLLQNQMTALLRKQPQSKASVAANVQGALNIQQVSKQQLVWEILCCQTHRSCILSRRTRIGPRHWNWSMFAQAMLKTVHVNVMVLYRWKERCSRARPAAPLRSLWRRFWRPCRRRHLCRRSPFLSVQLDSAWLTLSLWPVVCWHNHLQDIWKWVIIGISRYFTFYGNGTNSCASRPLKCEKIRSFVLMGPETPGKADFWWFSSCSLVTIIMLCLQWFQPFTNFLNLSVICDEFYFKLN